MASTLNYLEYYFPELTTLVDNTDTNIPQITLNIPDAIASNPFVRVVLELIAHDRNTTLGNISRRQISMRLGGAGYTVINNANAIANGGEQQTILFSGDFTSHFNTNWTGTSMTCDAMVLMDSAVASPLNPAFNNISAMLRIFYYQEDTSATKIKTVRIPLNCPVGAMGTTKPASLSTIPALDTELPEASKVFRQTVVVMQGNDNGSSTDLTLNMQIDSLTASLYASQVYEHGSNCNMFIRNTSIQSFDTSTTHTFHIWGSAAVFHHFQSYMVVTYEYDSTANNQMFICAFLPMEVDSPMGGVNDTSYQRATREFWIQENNPTTKAIAFFGFFDSLGAISGINMRVGTGSFVTYTDVGAVFAGSNAFMCRNDSAFTLARGRNSLSFDIYRTDTTDMGYNLGGFWIINYICDKPSGGYHKANKFVADIPKTTGTTAAAVEHTISAFAITIPETDYFINALGAELKFVPSGTVATGSPAIGVERLSAGEGGLIWERVYADINGTDGETGVYHAYAQMRTLFRRWTGDFDTSRLDIEVARRWRTHQGQSVGAFNQLSILMTYHSITYTVSGNITNSAGGTVNIYLCRTATNEVVLSTSRVGNGSYSFTWFDNTEQVYVMAYESGTLLGRSDNGYAT